MMRVLHVVSTLGRGSGMMSFINNYYRKIDKSKFQFDFLYFSDISDSYEDEIMRMGGKVFKIGRPSLSRKYKRKVKEFFEANKNVYAAVHCHPIFASYLFHKPCKSNGINNIIQHSHSSKFSNKSISAIRNYIIGLSFDKSATDFMACSESAAKLLKGKFNNKRDITIINNAIDMDKYKYKELKRKEMRTRLGIKEYEFVIGNIGRFSKEKNHRYLINLFSNIYKINPKSKLLLVGDGILRDEIVRMVNERSLERNVLFTGVRDDVNDLLSAMDVFVLPSTFEGLGMVAIESQASGMYTFCSNGVPSEAFITDRAIRFNLEDNLHELAIKVNSFKNYERVYQPYGLVNSGFDITKEVLKLENFYLSLHTKLGENEMLT